MDGFVGGDVWRGMAVGGVVSVAPAWRWQKKEVASARDFPYAFGLGFAPAQFKSLSTLILFPTVRLVCGFLGGVDTRTESVLFMSYCRLCQLCFTCRTLAPISAPPTYILLLTMDGVRRSTSDHISMVWI
jgi:hypothetical protein